jgi:elongation factor 3
MIVRHVLYVLFNGLDDDHKWQTKAVALQLIESMVDQFADAINVCIPEIVPFLSTAIWDSKPQVQEAAISALTKCCSVIDNMDVKNLIPR